MDPFQPFCDTLNRRLFIKQASIGLGAVAMSSAFGPNLMATTSSYQITPKAKRVIFLFMAGAPSQLELFDNKPALAKHHGKQPPQELVENLRLAFAQRNAKLMGPQYKFAKHGKCGAEISEIMPHLAKFVDDIAIVRSLKTDQFNHAPAQILFNTGSPLPGRPSIGSWVTYGLGAETDDLPAFVVLSSGRGSSGGTANFGSGSEVFADGGTRQPTTGQIRQIRTKFQVYLPVNVCIERGHNRQKQFGLVGCQKREYVARHKRRQRRWVANITRTVRV